MPLAAMANMPLECKICPKNPEFSDVSHLLTHIASKAHLSRYYQMKVKASTDRSSRTQINAYDDWYERYNLDELMRERLSHKESKRRGGAARTAATATANAIAASRRTSAGQSLRQSSKRIRSVAVTVVTVADEEAVSEVPSASSRSASVAPMGSQNRQRGPRQRPLHDSMLNPQLDARVKIEPQSRAGTPVSFHGMEPMDMHVHTATMYAPSGWANAASPYGEVMIKQEMGSESRSEDDDDGFVPGPPTGCFYRSRAYRNSGSGDTFSIADDEWDDQDEEDQIGETTSDAAKLKGVLWPGMAMFDSATPDMRRKRNQKKDYSVLETLKATSEFTEPTEMIFDQQGVKRKEREITGNPELDEDDSLLSGEIEPEPEEPPPRKKKSIRKPRQALVEKDRNTGRVTRRRTGGSHFGRSSRGPYFGDTAHGGGDDDDDDLTYGPPSRRQRAGPSIHRDNSGPEITFDQSSNPLDMLARGWRHPYQQQRQRSSVQYSQPPAGSQSSHRKLPSFGGMYGNNTGYSGSFRPGPSGISSFGGLNTQTLFQHNPFPTTSGVAALQAFQDQFGSGNQAYGNTGHVYGAAPNNWDVFAGLGQDLGLGGIGAGVGGNLDVSAFAPGTELNPLFFSSNQATPAREDDEVTVSPPPTAAAAAGCGVVGVGNDQER